MLLLTIDAEWARFHSRAVYKICLIFLFSREDEAENFEIMEDAVSESANLNVIQQQESQLKSKYGNLEKKRVSNRSNVKINAFISKNDVSPKKDMLNNRRRCLNSLLRINTVVELRMFLRTQPVQKMKFYAVVCLFQSLF